MTRARRRWAAVLGLLLLGACTWFRADTPERSCEVNSDCFVAQGEVCDDGECVERDLLPDASIDATTSAAP